MAESLKAKIKKRAVEYVQDNLQTLPVYSANELRKQNTSEVEDYFCADDGRKIPVLKKHRYSLKPCWAVFGPLMALHELDQRELLDEKTRTFFQRARGHRTLTVPLPEVRSVLQPFLEKHKDLFLSENIPDMGRRILKPSLPETKKLIAHNSEQHKKLLEKIENFSNQKWNKNQTVLEIGYTSGGESIIAFEHLGLNAIGIDNFYDDHYDTNSRHDYIASQVGSKAHFILGDITQKTSIEDNSVDLVFTQSVLEHIQDISAAFKEMERVLKPGGLMFHRYDPYFHIRGGHTPSTLDSPWAHMRLTKNDVDKYIKQFRPHEAEITLPWIHNALNRKHTQTYVQSELIKAGFCIYWWQNTPVSRNHADQITPSIIAECLEVNSGVSLSDLLTGSVAFIAKKEN